MGTKTRRRRVIVGADTPRGKGNRSKLWAYSYADIATACGMTLASVRKACQERRDKPPTLDPSSLTSVAAFVVEHQAKLVKRAAR